MSYVKAAWRILDLACEILLVVLALLAAWRGEHAEATFLVSIVIWGYLVDIRGRR